RHHKLTTRGSILWIVVITTTCIQIQLGNVRGAVVVRQRGHRLSKLIRIKPASHSQATATIRGIKRHSKVLSPLSGPDNGQLIAGKTGSHTNRPAIRSCLNMFPAIGNKTDPGRLRRGYGDGVTAPFYGQSVG